MSRDMLWRLLKVQAEMVLKMPLNYFERKRAEDLVRQLDNLGQECWDRVKKERPELAPMGMVPFMDSDECKKMGGTP